MGVFATPLPDRCPTRLPRLIGWFFSKSTVTHSASPMLNGSEPPRLVAPEWAAAHTALAAAGAKHRHRGRPGGPATVPPHAVPVHRPAVKGWPVGRAAPRAISQHRVENLNRKRLWKNNLDKFLSQGFPKFSGSDLNFPWQISLMFSSQFLAQFFLHRLRPFHDRPFLLHESRF